MQPPYVDPGAVERAVTGDRVALHPLERRTAVHALTQRGLSAREVAEWVGVSARTVQRHRGRQPVEVIAFG